jgi:superfamily II DNA helicase RecQ
MDDIYSVLVTMDFPDALTGGLRRTTDVLRGVMEKTRSDLTLVIRQKALETKIVTLHKEESGENVLTKSESHAEKLKEGQEKEPDLDEKEKELYEALTKWRTRKSNEEGLSPFIIAHNSMLKQIVKIRPATPKDLNQIVGFGERRVNKYGREIIAIVNEN